MRELREHFALTQQDVSERLHIRVKYIAAMEAGQFDSLPGKVYARGYVHTYAEFLGLEPEQVVERCFGPIAPSEAQTLYVPVKMQRRRLPRGWVALIAFAIVAIIMFVASGDKQESGEDVAETGEVENVPESLLGSMRVLPMGNSITRDCFEGRTLLGCFFAQDLTQDYVLPAGRISRIITELAPPEPEPEPAMPKAAAQPVPEVKAGPAEEAVAEPLPENYEPSVDAPEEE